MPAPLRHPFRFGLLLATGALTAFTAWTMIGALAPILWSIALAAFFAIGITPLVRAAEKWMPRPLALGAVVSATFAALAGIVLMIVPAIVAQTGQLLSRTDEFAASGSLQTVAAHIQQFVPESLLDVSEFFDGMLRGLQSGTTLQSFSNGVFGAGSAIASGFFFISVVLVMTVYFLSSGPWLRALLLTALPQRARYAMLRVSSRVGSSVSRCFLGQLLLAVLNGALALVVLVTTGGALPVLFAAVALVCALIPLVGIPLGAAIIVASQALFMPGNPLPWITLAAWFALYMALDAYVIAPRIIGRAADLRVVVVLVATLVGGALFGILGAFLAVPAAVVVAESARELRTLRRAPVAV